MILLILIGLVLTFLQITLIPGLSRDGVFVDLVVPYLIAVAIVRQGREGLLMAFVLGLVISHYSGIHFGFLPLFYVVIAFLSSLVHHERDNANLPLTLSAACGLMVLFEIFVLMSFLFSGFITWQKDYIITLLLPRLFFNLLVFVLFFPLLRKLAARLFPERQGMPDVRK